jgi:hypothetical protein
MARTYRYTEEGPGNEVRQKPIGKAGQQRPGPSSRFLCPRPPLRSFTQEMGPRQVGIIGANARKPFRQSKVEGLLSRFLRSQLRRIGLGHPLQARPRSGQAVSTNDAVPEPELQLRPPLRTQRPRSPQACQRGASPRRILVSLGGLLIAVAEPTPLQRSWMSPLGARPLADRFQTTTRRKSFARSVTFLHDPTIPISVTWLNDLTGGQDGFGSGRQSPILGTTASREEGRKRRCDESWQARCQNHARRGGRAGCEGGPLRPFRPPPNRTSCECRPLDT